MKPEELMEIIEKYGGDMTGINERFMGNTKLYAACFEEFMREPALDKLGTSIAAGDYAAAFGSAHAIKGISGNMGLVPLYKSVCLLVETLRAKNYENVGVEYAAVREQIDRIKKCYYNVCS